MPERCEEDAVAAGQDSLLEEVGSKARVGRIEGGHLGWSRLLASAVQENEERLD